MTIKDTGQRESWNTGAQRDSAEGKGRFDLLPFYGVEAVAQVFEEGAQKYSANNWRKGIPIKRYLDSGLRHAHKAAEGMEDEPHLAMACWNLMCAIHTMEMVAQGELPDNLLIGSPYDARDETPDTHETNI